MRGSEFAQYAETTQRAPERRGRKHAVPDSDRRFRVRFTVARKALPAEVTMLRLKRAQREMLADKLSDLGNLAAGALVFGQALTADVSILAAVSGLVLWAACMAMSIYIAGGAK
jgi:hypothetical protein